MMKKALLFVLLLLPTLLHAQLHVGSYNVGDSAIIYLATGDPGNDNAPADMDSVPTYRCYANENGTAIATGSFAKLDDSNTTGFYSESVSLAGRTLGDSVACLITATIGSFTGQEVVMLQVGANVNVSAFGGTAGTFAGGRPEINLSRWNGTAVNNVISGRPDVTVGAMQSDTVTAAAIATDALTATEIAANALGASELAADAGTEIGTATWATTTRQLTATQTFDLTGNVTGNLSGSVGSVTGNVGGMTAAGIASTFFTTNSGSTYGAAVAGSPVKEIADNAATSASLAIVTGTSDSGSTTTMVDAARTEADNDYWKGRQICFTSGNISGQCAWIEDFVAATDTFTFRPAFTQAVSTQNYAIYAAVSDWDSTMAEHTTAGTTGASLNAAGVATDPWTATMSGYTSAGTFGNAVRRLPEVNAGASGGLFLAGTNAATTVDITGSLSGSVGSVSGNVNGNVVGSVGSVATGGITAASIATDAIGADEIATAAIGAPEIATDAIGADEIATAAIGASEMATDAIGALEIATDAIGAAELAASAINASEAPNLDMAVSTRGTHSVKKQTSFIWPMKFVSSVNHVLPVSGVAPTCTRSIDSVNAFSATTNTATTTTTLGFSQITISIAEMNGDHFMVLHCTATGADPVDVTFKIEQP